MVILMKLRSKLRSRFHRGQANSFFLLIWILLIWIFLPLAQSLGAATSSHAPVLLKSEGASDAKTLFISKVLALVQFITSDQPCSQQALDLLEGKITDSKDDRNLMVRGDGYKVVLMITRSQENSLVSDISFYPDLDLGVRFKDLTTILGEWRKIHESKTSSVQFEYTHPKFGKKASIFVELMFPPRDPESPVLQVDIRREGF